MTDHAETKTGLDAIAAMFESASAQKRAAFLPYFPVGYPTYEDSLGIFLAMSEAGVDGFEIGMPFSDPLADGPTIQAATQVALENGVTTRKCIEAVRYLREHGVRQPMLLMGYLNPVLAYGLERFVEDAKAAGADGVVVPDLPPDETVALADSCMQHGMAFVCFLAPTSNTERIELVAQKSSGFIYLVSVTGVTGTRTALPSNLKDFINRVRSHTDKPLVLGFGISQPEQARMMNDLVNGFIVGSALVKAAKDGVESVRRLATNLRRALDS